MLGKERTFLAFGPHLVSAALLASVMILLLKFQGSGVELQISHARSIRIRPSSCKASETNTELPATLWAPPHPQLSVCVTVASELASCPVAFSQLLRVTLPRQIGTDLSLGMVLCLHVSCCAASVACFKPHVEMGGCPFPRLVGKLSSPQPPEQLTPNHL